MPTAAYAAYLFGLPQGGQLNVCTVYASKYGASQRGSYTLTYTPPPAAAAASAGGVTGVAASTASSLGIPTWALVFGGAAAVFFATR